MSNRLLMLLTGTALSLVPAMGRAQTAAGSADAPQQDGRVELEEIVVTAQRREESLQRAAVSVTAVSGSPQRRVRAQYHICKAGRRREQACSPDRRQGYPGTEKAAGL